MIWILLLLGLIVGTSIYSSIREFGSFAFSIDINMFKSPCFELGISHRHWHNDTGDCIETTTIGFYVFNLVFDFFQIKEDE